MKEKPKDYSAKPPWDQIMATNNKNMLRSMLFSILFISMICYLYTFTYKPQNSQLPCHHDDSLTAFQKITNQTQPTITTSPSVSPQTDKTQAKTTIKHVVFGIGASAKLWDHRKEYIKLWWRPQHMRGFVWLDKRVKNNRNDENLLPPLMISSDTSKFKYNNKRGHRSAIRISRIVSETLRLGLKDVRWFVMGDDDTVFVADNLVRVLSKYDHEQYYYIGSSSESHLQNINFSYNMAYGGAGFAISYPLAVALEKIQDRCIQRYPKMYGSDDRIQACMAELGVPLTKESGFHQFDVYGNLFGLLAAHPITPLVSIHHLDVVEPIFPNVGRVEALQRLNGPIKLDSAGLMQQSICYDKTRYWTVSVSWGYAVQIFRGILLAREMEFPSRTFLNWYKRADYNAYSFNTRPVSKHVCQTPFIYYLSNAHHDDGLNQTTSEYVQYRKFHPKCSWKMMDPSRIDRVEVYKRADPTLWDKAKRRNCCRILPTEKNRTILIDVGVCREGETITFR